MIRKCTTLVFIILITFCISNISFADNAQDQIDKLNQKIDAIDSKVNQFDKDGLIGALITKENNLIETTDNAINKISLQVTVISILSALILILATLGNNFIQNARFKRLEEDYKKLVELKTNFEESKREYEKSMQEFKKVEANYGELNDNMHLLDSQLRSTLDQAASSQKELDEVKNILNDFVSRAKKSEINAENSRLSAEASTYINKAFEAKDYHEKINHINKAISIKPDYDRAYVLRGDIYASRKEYDKALIDYDYALHLKEDPNTYNCRAIVFYRLGKYENAITDYLAAVRIDPKNPIYYDNMGVNYSKLGKYDDALKCYDTAIELDPNYYMPYNNRANTYRRLLKLDIAEDDILKAISINSADGLLYSTLAEINAQRNNDEDFKKYITIALQKGCPIWEYIQDPAYAKYLNESWFIELIEKYKTNT